VGCWVDGVVLSAFLRRQRVWYNAAIPSCSQKKRLRLLPPTIRIVRPSSRETSDLLASRLSELRAAGFDVRYDDIPRDPSWTYTSSTALNRAAALQSALFEKGVSFIWAARGGYGASDLLPLLDWGGLSNSTEKVLLGFSDISALHAAFYAKLGWRGWHAPMPATTLWRLGGDADVVELLSFLHSWSGGAAIRGENRCEPIVSGGSEFVEGKLFGGCFSVLTSLIGTPYFPDLKDHILFIEDVDESPARLMRYLNQWIQSGVVRGVRALVVGSLKDLGENIPDSATYVLKEMARRLGPIPVFHSSSFGHVSPNFTLPIGAHATLSQGRLAWHLAPIERTSIT
jgi:muramoyltetrapeptide carboxypeptidase